MGDEWLLWFFLVFRERDSTWGREILFFNVYWRVRREHGFFGVSWESVEKWFLTLFSSFVFLVSTYKILSLLFLVAHSLNLYWNFFGLAWWIVFKCYKKKTKKKNIKWLDPMLTHNNKLGMWIIIFYNYFLPINLFFSHPKYPRNTQQASTNPHVFLK
jgi:hypothetical protein